MSFKDEVRNVQNSNVNTNLEKYTNMLKDEIKRIAANGGDRVELHNFSGFNIGGSVARVNLFEAREEICKGEGFNMLERYVGKAGSYRAGGDRYIYGITWKAKNEKV